MKKKISLFLLAFAFATVFSQVSAETWIVYTFNGATHVYHTSKTIDCANFDPAPGVVIVECFN